MLAIVSIFPLGKKGPSLSREVAPVIELVDKSGLDYRVTPMGTILEGEWDAVMKLLKKVRDGVLKKSERIYMSVTIDDRKGRHRNINYKVASIEKILGRPVRQ